MAQDVLAWLRGRSNDLLPFDAIADQLQAHQQVRHPSPVMIPLDRVVGSVGRYRDFNRHFLPRTRSLRDRWRRVEAKMSSMEGLPPIEVFKIGDVFFVVDGNHRVSVARANGFDAIEAHVIELPIDPGLKPGDTLDQAIIKAGRARFYAQTGLERRVPHPDIYFTAPGGWSRLLEHVEAHRRLMEEAQGAAVSVEDAAVDWYYERYVPIIRAIRDRNLLDRFPNRTASDLYIWVWSALAELYRAFGEPVSASEGVSLLELRAEAGRGIRTLMQEISEIGRRDQPARAEIPDWISQPVEWGDPDRQEGREEGDR